MIVTQLIAMKRIANALVITSGQTDYSNSVELIVWSGFESIEIVLAALSNVTVTQQCSNDNSTWYDPVDSDGNAIGQVCTALTTSKFIQPGGVLTKFIRYKIVANANSTITMRLTIRE